MRTIRIQDVTLRDGNHAMRHTLDVGFIAEYCQVVDDTTVDVVEVGHGMGIGASSLLVGRAAETDQAVLATARENLKSTGLGVHSIPGFSTIDCNLKPAMDLGVDIFRIATHVTEADTSIPHIEFVRTNGREAVGVLMMSHMATPNQLVQQARVMESAGAQSIVIMDSAGHYSPRLVKQRISGLVDGLDVPVGFHAHNNYGAAIANSLAALEAGAWSIDGATMGLGAGSGNAQLECLIAVIELEFNMSLGLDRYLVLSEMVETRAAERLPRTTSTSVVSGVSGVVSAFSPYVKAVSEELGVPQSKIWARLGERRIVAGQESIIKEVALDLLADKE